MSQYLQSLGHISRQRYLQRLKVLGLAEDDPYLETKLERFTDHQMTAWPQIEFGHILDISSKGQVFLHKRNCWIGRVCKLTISFRVVLFALFPLGLLMHIYIDYLHGSPFS